MFCINTTTDQPCLHSSNKSVNVRRVSGLYNIVEVPYLTPLLLAMAKPLLVRAPWAKGKVDTYTLHHDGQFTGYMHSEGFAFQMNSDVTAPISEDIDLVSCRNDATMSSKGTLGRQKWCICASISKPANSIPVGPFSCEMVLVRGVARKDGRLHCMYSLWSGYFFPYTSLSAAMKAYRTPRKFCKATFHDEICLTSVDDMFVRYMTQISGPTLEKWNRVFPTATRDGEGMYLQMS